MPRMLGKYPEMFFGSILQYKKTAIISILLLAVFAGALTAFANHISSSNRYDGIGLFTEGTGTYPGYPNTINFFDRAATCMNGSPVKYRVNWDEEASVVYYACPLDGGHSDRLRILTNVTSGQTFGCDAPYTRVSYRCFGDCVPGNTTNSNWGAIWYACI